MGNHVWKWWLTAPVVLLAVTASYNAQGENMRAEREAMLEEIQRSVERTAEYTGRKALNPRVMQAIGEVPREAFVLPAYRQQAYDNRPLPIDKGQTISQPLIVALMTDFLDPQPEDIVLEVGTGSGYQAAVLSRLVRHVYSVEIHPELAENAETALVAQGYDNVTVRAGDGYAGWLEHAPFDGIIVTAAPEKIPPPLLKQLKPGGKLIIPVGEEYGHQELLLIEVGEDGETRRQSLLPVRFVPLTGDREETP